MNYKEIDFEVTWNADMTSDNYSESNFATEALTTSQLCDQEVTQSAKMQSNVAYTEANDAGGTTFDLLSGVGIDGIAIYNALNSSDEDAIAEIEEADLCLGATESNFYFHRVLSPCAVSGSSIASTSAKPGLCGTGTGTACLDNDYMLTDWPTADYGGIYGLARDGHIISGPYNADGELWVCDDLDVCNGFTDEDGNYRYASTSKFPYTVGCWGPGPAVNIAPSSSCSTNACASATPEEAGAVELGLATAALILTAVLQVY